VNGGYPPIMWTAIRGHLECLQWLVETLKVDYDICDSEGMTPLDNAVIQARYECALYLKKKGQLLKSAEFYKTKNTKFLFD
jgi:ankyrin repeat protein